MCPSRYNVPVCAAFSPPVIARSEGRATWQSVFLVSPIPHSAFLILLSEVLYMARNKLKTEQKEILWKDRRRILGLPISFTRYSLDEDRLYIKRGFFNTELDEILLYRILDIKSSQTLWQKLFGVGTLILFSADQSNPELRLKNVRHPSRLHRYLSDLIERSRIAKGIAGREIMGMASYGVHGHGNDCEHDELCGHEPPHFDPPDLPPDVSPIEPFDAE